MMPLSFPKPYTHEMDWNFFHIIFRKILDDFSNCEKMTKCWIKINHFYTYTQLTEIKTLDFRVAPVCPLFSGAIEALPLQKLVLYFFFKYLKRLYSYFVFGTEKRQ